MGHLLLRSTGASFMSHEPGLTQTNPSDAQGSWEPLQRLLVLSQMQAGCAGYRRGLQKNSWKIGIKTYVFGCN